MKAMWDTCPLGDLADFKNGLNYTRNSGGTTLPVVGVGDFAENFYAPLFQLETATIDGELDSNYQLKENDILIVRSNGSKALVGRSMLVPAVTGAVSYSGFVIRVRITRDSVDPTFVLHFLKSPDTRDRLTLSGGGANISNINQQSLSTLRIPVPPLAEQQRIVGILDEAFEGIATAKANAEKNLQNARALFESHLQSVFTQRGEGWVETTVGEIIRFIDYRGKTPTKTASGIRLITAKNVKMGYLQDEPMEFIAIKDYDGWMTRGIPKKGDVLFTTEAPLANVAQLDTDDKVAFAQRVIIMQPDQMKLDSTFLKYLLLSTPAQESIRSQGTGATVQGIKASLLKQIRISFPSDLSLQQQLVEVLDSLSEETQRLATIYARKLAALDDLKKSLLHQAFSGKL